MDCIESNGFAICGNFAERLPQKPKNLPDDKTAKWYEDYPFDWREVLGNTICNCKKMKVNFDPWFGFDYFHLDNCNLMKKLESEPQIYNLREINLPRLTHYTDSVPNKKRIPLYVKGRNKASKILVKVFPPQLSLNL